jgi:hypothetical protein
MTAYRLNGILAACGREATRRREVRRDGCAIKHDGEDEQLLKQSFHGGEDEFLR